MRVEEIIKKQRDQLDVEQPPLDAWSDIRDQWKGESKKSVNHWWRAAAAIFIASTIGLLIYSLSLQQKVNELATLGDISEKYQAIEKEYQVEIRQLESTTNLQEVSKQEDFDWIVQEMKILEDINEIYRKDIGQVADQDQLVDALIDYYEKKVRLLKKLELEIERTQKFNKDEKDDNNTLSI